MTTMNLDADQVKTLRAAWKKNGAQATADATGIAKSALRRMVSNGTKQSIRPDTMEKITKYLGKSESKQVELPLTGAPEEAPKPKSTKRDNRGAAVGDGVGSTLLSVSIIKRLTRAIEKSSVHAVGKALHSSGTNLKRLLSRESGARLTTLENIEAFLEGRPLPHPKETRKKRNGEESAKNGKNGAGSLAMLEAPSAIVKALAPFAADTEGKIRVLRYCLETLERSSM
jgi:DNA-binding Xre family transcriptional regulator